MRSNTKQHRIPLRHRIGPAHNEPATNPNGVTASLVGRLEGYADADTDNGATLHIPRPACHQDPADSWGASEISGVISDMAAIWTLLESSQYTPGSQRRFLPEIRVQQFLCNAKPLLAWMRQCCKCLFHLGWCWYFP
ncbi:MAG: hypothetical protein JO142_17225 [Burkholderiales bacterium]|nr:hypothetical protein [Burkholderiales bacterium]